jgi:hypothetical protein
MHVYAPWWLDNKKLDFPRGYHIEFGGGMGMPIYGFQLGHREPQRELKVMGKKEDAGGYGASLKKDYRAFLAHHVGMAGRGEAVAKKRTIAEIDPDGVVDKYGIPVLQFNTSHSDYEINQAKHMMETFSEILHAMGAIVTHGQDNAPPITGGCMHPAISSMRQAPCGWAMTPKLAAEQMEPGT